MRYYLDSEFIDDGFTVDLISIGIVCEDGREYYAQSSEFESMQASPWVKENVISHLLDCGAFPDDPRRYHEFMRGRACTRLDCVWRSRQEIREEVSVFLDPSKYGNPQFYTWCGSYDHIVFCQLFGPMMALPEGYPHHVYDLQCILSDQGIEDSELPPQSEGLHNALADARHIKKLWQIYGLNNS